MTAINQRMAELESEDSSDCALIIDEPQNDLRQIEIIDDANSDVEIVELEKNMNYSYSLFNTSSSSSRIGSTCKYCSRMFPTNNELINHARKFNGRNCTVALSNVQQSVKLNKAKDLTFEQPIKKKRGRPPKRTTVIVPKLKSPVPESMPLLPHYIPVIIKNPNPPPTINVMPSLPSLSRVLIDEIEPEYPCTKCDQIFRHNIGLICHLNSEHNEITSHEVINVKKNSSVKLSEKKKYAKKNKDNKQIEDDEPVSDTINLTLMPDFKKDSIMNRMKSYVYSATKDKVICVVCNINFKNTKKALAHVEDKHITDKIECGYCNMKFVYELKLRSHMAKRHKVIGVYKCDSCSKMINREECELHKEKCEGKANLVNIKKENVEVSN